MVARQEAFLLPIRRGEHRSRGVIDAVGEELERKERMRRRALAQVQLDGVVPPGAAPVADRDEVDREAS